MNYVNFPCSSELLRMGSSQGGGAEVAQQGIRAGGGEGCRQALPACPGFTDSSTGVRLWFLEFFYICVVHFENMNGDPASTWRLRCGIMNIPLCKLMLGFFLPEPMNSLFFQHGKHKLEVFQKTLENSNLGLKPVESPFFLSLYFIREDEFQPL